MHIAITGASGLIGTALSADLAGRGHRVTALVRRPVGPDEDALGWDPTTGQIDREGLAEVDAVVHLAGAGIGDHRWNEDYRREILESRTRSTGLLAETLADLADGPKVFLSGSAIGIYGDRGDEVLTEASPTGTGFLAEVAVAWEQAAAPAVEAGVRTTFLRTGVVLSASGGALSKLLPLFRLGLGGKMGRGNQYWSWISIVDEVAAIRFLLEHDIAGPVNLTAPQPATNAEFTKTLGGVLRRPSFLAVPEFAPKLLRGSDLAEQLLFWSQRVQPSALEQAGFVFSHPALEAALRELLGKPAPAA